MSKIVIFGTGDIAQLAHYYFTHDSQHDVVAFTVDKQFLKTNIFEGKPVISFDDVIEKYPPSSYAMFIALSYAKLNRFRREKYEAAKAMGYILQSYISSRCTYLSTHQPGDNCFILEDNTIQPFVTIANNVTMWSGNHIGHHSQIASDNFISSHVVISGHCVIEPNCFLGVNATIANNVTVSERCIIGAGAIITADTKPGAVHVPAKSVILTKDSSQINL